jgi:hypothetical protein
MVISAAPAKQFTKLTPKAVKDVATQRAMLTITYCGGAGRIIVQKCDKLAELLAGYKNDIYY